MKKTPIREYQRAAAAAGHKTFNTGTPCLYGHKSERHTSSGQCIACIRGEPSTRRKIVRIRAPKGTALFGFLHDDDRIAVLEYARQLQEYRKSLIAYEAQQQQKARSEAG